MAVARSNGMGGGGNAVADVLAAFHAPGPIGGAIARSRRSGGKGIVVGGLIAAHGVKRGRAAGCAEPPLHDVG